MTYMSIPDDLELFVQAKLLHCMPSMWFGFETAREIYASTDVFTAVADPFGSDGPQADLIAEFRATFDGFLEGGQFSVAEDPRDKPFDSMLARVEPVEREFWDIRSVAPSPGIRCFGGFHSKDCFIALTWNFRENIIDFDAEVDDCIKTWQGLFGAHVTPHHGRSLDDYLSNYISV